MSGAAETTQRHIATARPPVPRMVKKLEWIEMAQVALLDAAAKFSAVAPDLRLSVQDRQKVVSRIIDKVRHTHVEA